MRITPQRSKPPRLDISRIFYCFDQVNTCARHAQACVCWSKYTTCLFKKLSILWKIQSFILIFLHLKLGPCRKKTVSQDLNARVITINNCNLLFKLKYECFVPKLEAGKIDFCDKCYLKNSNQFKYSTYYLLLWATSAESCSPETLC